MVKKSTGARGLAGRGLVKPGSLTKKQQQAVDGRALSEGPKKKAGKKK
jgi:hypothetical protein